MHANRLALAVTLYAGWAQADAIRPATPVAATAQPPAPPELALGDAQLVLGARRRLLDRESQEPYYRVAGFAQLTAGGSARGDLGAGVAGAVGGLGCDAIAGAAQGRLRPLAEERLVGEATWSVCLARIGLTAVLDGRDGIGLAPAIDARRSLWSRRYDERYRRATIGLGEAWLPGSPHRYSVFVLAIGHRGTAQRDGVERRNVVELDLEFAMVRYRHVTERHELAIDGLVVTSDSIKAGDSSKGGVTYAVLPGRVRFVTPTSYVAVQAGIGVTGGKDRASSMTTVNGEVVDAWDDEIDGDGLPSFATPVGSVTAGIVRCCLDASLSASRAFYPTFEGNVALENRLAGALTWPEHRGAPSVTVAPFVAQTRTWTRDAGSASNLGFGTSLRAGYRLGDGLRLDAIGEAGMTPYTRLDGSRLADRLGGQLAVALSGQIQR